MEKKGASRVLPTTLRDCPWALLMVIANRTGNTLRLNSKGIPAGIKRHSHLLVTMVESWCISNIIGELFAFKQANLINFAVMITDTAIHFYINTRFYHIIKLLTFFFIFDSKKMLTFPKIFIWIKFKYDFRFWVKSINSEFQVCIIFNLRATTDGH